ncbi:sodium:proton exchanger [Lacihabitans sp. LS3-19]|uniref:cation:proton antiporter domain-containing protein n=1 Tax=Lacihabitans sp. LS3-19 TaxID=2487335 RepID=UPI0020CD7CC8|nr:cation:proton antiporter [Lacihabitans sp. LS3-19]MCP9767291.1 sodium:proton exchanger [Lacihabitans sp. LS3-19]
MQSSILVLFIASIVILSYFFNIFSKRTKIPTVLLLMSSGMLFNFFEKNQLISMYTINKVVELLGIMGLIMIILEASLDLHITRKKKGLILKAFISALIILIVSSFSIAYLIHFWLNEPLVDCLIYATPLSIVSSAILIPSLEQLTPDKKEFLVYESSFSDILGILFFNYLIGENTSEPLNAIIYLGQMGLSVIISILVAFLLVYYLGKIKLKVKFFLIFAVLSALYALGKLTHLPSLLIILFFGLIINNRQLFQKFKWIDKHIPDEMSFLELEKQLKSVTAETSFLVRTFFFILFGYSIDILKLAVSEVQIVGTLIVVILLIVRLAFLLYLNPKENPLPELFLMPRGLITILLFYNIPPPRQLEQFNSGILFFVILVTAVLMMIGLFTAKGAPSSEDIEV